MRLLAAALALSTVSALAQPPAQSLPLCHASDLSLTLDDENGSFNGMSHSGTLVVLRNLAPSACRVPPLAEIGFEDAAHAALPIKTTIAGTRFMHPGPVVLPVALAPAAELTASLRWVLGEVFTNSLCLHPASLTVNISGEKIRTPLTATLCGERSTGVSLERSRFVTDPIYQPTNASAPAAKP